MKSLSIILLVLVSTFSFGQSKSVKKETIKVWGNCGMCKKTIETAAKSAGASQASWDTETKELQVSYAASKTSSDKIQQAIAASGYDTEKFTADNKAYDNLNKNGIDALVIIAGNGSFTGGLLFNKEFGFPVIGIPGTIDNDIYGTSFTLGYDTALNTVVEVIDKIRDTASSHNRLFFIEVMGRDAGHIALNAGIGAGAEEILIPEEDMGLDRLLESLRKSKASGKSSSIVVIAEGDKIGKNAFELKDYVEENMPEYDVRVSILGHMQRGGAPTCFDRVLASRLGVKAVESLLEGKSNYMAGLLKDEIVLTPLEQAVKGKSQVDKELIRVSDIVSI